MKESKKISNAEMKIMNKLWEHEEMITIADMIDLLKDEKEEWAYQTVATFLKRLEAKKMISSIKVSNKLFYFPIVSKESYQNQEAHTFIERKFQGSLKNFLVAFSGDEGLNKDEIHELKDWFNQLDN